MENKSKRIESRSRLPRISNQLNGQQKCSTDTSSIPRSTKLINNNTIINKLINCNTDREGPEKTSDNSNRNYKTINNYYETESYSNDIQTINTIKTSSLCKSQSLNEIQYENNTNFTKVNNSAIGCDAIKAFSFEQLDENFSNLNSSSLLTKEEIINSDNNLMEMSVDESSTASLGLLPSIMSSSMSPFDTLNPNIPLILNENDFINDNITVTKTNSIQFISNDGDDDSENGIPVILEDESDSNITITESNERPVSPLLITDGLDVNSSENYSLDNTMESMNTTVVEHEMAVEFKTMNLDNAINETNRKSFTDNNNEMRIESNVDNRNTSETNIPINFDNSLHERKVCNEINKTMREEKVISKIEKSSQVIVKSFNESKTSDFNRVRVENRKSSAIRPNSLNTTVRRDTKLLITGTEKVQRAASPSSKASVRKKIKTPGKWDAVMNKIEQSKTNLNQTNKTLIKGRVNSNITRNVIHNGSLPKISPLSELSIDMDSSHLTPSTPSVKSGINKKTTITNPTKATIPKSKTFVRDLNANNTTAGNKSQQPLQEPPQLQPAAVMPTQPSITSHTIKKGVVASINDKKTPNRRPTQTTTANNTFTSKRSTNIKSNASTLHKKDLRSDDKQQIQKLTQLCEYKTKQLKTLCLDQNYMRLAFDSLSLVIQHLVEKYTPFENPKLQQALQNANKRCEQLKDNLDAKDLELNDMKIIYEEQINQLMKEREKNYSDLNQAKVNHETNVKKLFEMHSWEVKTLEDKHNRELKICQQNCNQLLNEIQDKNNELNQTKQLKDALEIRVKQMEDNIMNDKDKKFKYLTEKTKQLELEVDSLKAVMDMKNERIHTLERQMIETQEKINELPIAKETIRGLQQQIENLQVTLERKIHQFNQLTREQEDLKSEYDREMREKRRLSMKNEELAYHLSESFNNESGFNNCTNYDSNHIRWKSTAIVTEETPIKTNRPFIGNASASAPSRKSHSKIIKSMSTSLSKTITPALYCRSSSSVNTNDNSFLSNGISDEVFDSGTKSPAINYQSSSSVARNESSFLSNGEVFDSETTFGETNFNRGSVRKSTKSKIFSHETPPQCILDSGFEEIQGLNSLPK